MTKCESCGEELKDDEKNLCDDCCASVYGECLFCGKALKSHEGYICDSCLALEDDSENGEI